MLWLALHLPRLPLEVLQRGLDATRFAANDVTALPFAIAAGGATSRILLPDAEAVRLGITPGMPLSAAYALVPDLVVRPRDPFLEAETLAGLALWAEQFTPTLSLAPPDVLLLEIGGCLTLFSGLESLLDRVRTGLTELGFDTCLACAPTPEGARLLARNGLEDRITQLDALRRRLAQLPVDGLDLPPEPATAFARLGLRTLGECLRLPRDGLARRFGQAVVDHFDRALGHRPDPRAPFIPPPRFTTRLALPAPVPEVERLLFGARRLILELTGFLAGRQAGVTRFALSLEHEDVPVTRVAVELSMPSRDPAHLALLVRERLSRTSLPAPVEAIRLDCEDAMQLAPRNFSFFPTAEAAAEDRVALVERLRSRLGRDAVHGLTLVPAHRPELAFREAEPGTAPPPALPSPRPLWLLHTPKPVAPQTLRLLSGPERIESGWWDGHDVRRDYFVALQTNHARCWVYRECAGTDATGKAAGERWFLHGYFA